MNVADSELVASLLYSAGYELLGADAPDDSADAVVINTCSIRDNAAQKIYGRISRWKALSRRLGRRIIVAVVGCMAERLQRKLIEDYGVDVVAGPDAYMSLPELMDSARAGRAAMDVELSLTQTYAGVMPRRVGGNRISGFVSIMRGCNNFCTYCIVPYTRGRERSRDPQSILAELADLRSTRGDGVVGGGVERVDLAHGGLDDGLNLVGARDGGIGVLEAQLVELLLGGFDLDVGVGLGGAVEQADLFNVGQDLLHHLELLGDRGEVGSAHV